MSQVITVRINFDVDTSSAERNLQKVAAEAYLVERLLTRTLGLLRRLGLPEKADRLVAAAQKVIMIVNQMRMTLQLFYLTSGPIGWALFALSAIGTGLTMGESIAYGGRGY